MSTYLKLALVYAMLNFEMHSIATHPPFLGFRRTRRMPYNNTKENKVTLLLQGCELQLRDWWLGPTQGRPPFTGAGLSHLRLLY